MQPKNIKCGKEKNDVEILCTKEKNHSQPNPENSLTEEIASYKAVVLT